MAMGYGPDGHGSIPKRGNIFLFSIAFTLALGPSSLLTNRQRGDPFPGEKLQGHEANHSPHLASRRKAVVYLHPHMCSRGGA